MSNSVDPIVPAPAGASGIRPVLCPFCGSSQFLSERRLSRVGHLFLWTGLAIVLVSLPLMYLCLGFVTFPIGLLMMIIAIFCRSYVNICVSCKRKF